MRRRLAASLLLTIVIGGGSWLHAKDSRAAPERAITLCHEDADVRPWRYRKGGGLNFQLIERAANRAGVRIHYQALPWKRCLASLQANEVDGIFAGSFRREQLAYGAYPGGAVPDAGKRLHTDRYVLLRRKGDSLDWDGKALTHLEGAIGTQLGYSVNEQLRALGVPIDEGAQTAVDVLRKLADGRLAGAAILAGEADQVLERNPGLRARLEVLPQPLVEKPYYLILSLALVQTQPALASRLWEATEAVRTSTAYRALERQTLAMLGGG